ncbi:helix-turn-helix domain-containing protein, partial [Streptomyces eurythermus]
MRDGTPSGDGHDTPPDGDFGQRLRRLRARAGLSREALSHAAQVSVRALADMERGRTRGPQRRTVRALAEALGLDGDEQVRELLAPTASAVSVGPESTGW